MFFQSFYSPQTYLYACSVITGFIVSLLTAANRSRHELSYASIEGSAQQLDKQFLLIAPTDDQPIVEWHGVRLEGGDVVSDKTKTRLMAVVFALVAGVFGWVGTGQFFVGAILSFVAAVFVLTWERGTRRFFGG